jgi:glycosyltransferase involved in cell wall biosynthesis
LKISICIPQYNRINYLLKSLAIIGNQTYQNIEIVISDDCSSDNTVEKIKELIPLYKYPIVFSRNEKNEGYDRNYRRSIELASGDYAFVIGNDDSIYREENIQFLVDFLKENNFPDIGFCNIIEESSGNSLIQRSASTCVLGAGADIAMKYYSCFSFVGGLIYKKSTFDKYNTNKYDGSIYAQMYLSVLMIATGQRLFSIKEPMVIKDILLDGFFRNGYRDTIARKWKDYKVVDNGLPSVINVLINALIDAKEITQQRIKFIYKRMYGVTFPYWILDFKDNGALPEAVGLIAGMVPYKSQDFKRLNTLNKVSIFILYLFSSFFALITPVFIFKEVKSRLYQYFKK